MPTIGVIGYRNHAAKIINLIKKNKNKINLIYHPKKKLNFKNYTNDLKELLKLDCVFLICPSKFHYNYLKYFHNNKYKGYIFCEKPPVITTKELNYLKKINLNKIYFNFNLRYSKLYEQLNHNKKLGNLVSINIFDSKPLIFKKSIIKDWRFKNKSTLVTNNLIHYVDLVFALTGKKPLMNNILCSKINKEFNLYDSIHLIQKFKNFVTNINISYATVLDQNFNFYFTNGKVEFKNNYLKIFYPAKIYDGNNRFSNPPLKKKIFIKNLFNESNYNSVKNFITIVKKQLLIDKKDQINSIYSNQFVINLSKQIKN